MRSLTIAGIIATVGGTALLYLMPTETRNETTLRVGWMLVSVIFATAGMLILCMSWATYEILTRIDVLK